LKYNAPTYSISFKDLSDVFNFVLICLLTLDIDSVLYTNGYFLR